MVNYVVKRKILKYNHRHGKGYSGTNLVDLWNINKNSVEFTKINFHPEETNFAI